MKTIMLREEEKKSASIFRTYVAEYTFYYFETVNTTHVIQTIALNEEKIIIIIF
jgi:hypothetical protein